MFLPTRALSRAAAVAFSAGISVVALSGCGAGVSNPLPIAAPSAANNVPSGPTLGYMFQPADGTLRALLGVRGSARVSASIVPAGVYVAGDASTASNAAVLEDEAGSLFAFNLPLSQPIHVADGLPAALHIAFAPAGRIAVAYAQGGTGITLISGLPMTPLAQDVPLAASAKLISATVSDAGTVVIAVAQGSGVQIGTLSNAGQFARIASAFSTPSFNFLSGSRGDDLLLADSGANTLAIVRNVASNPTVQPIAVAGLNQPIAVSVSRDNHWAAVVSGADSSILRVDLATGTSVVRLTCDCKPSMATALAGNAVFRVNTLGTGPVWTADLAGPSPQLLFVPAIAQAGAQSTALATTQSIAPATH